MSLLAFCSILKFGQLLLTVSAVMTALDFSTIKSLGIKLVVRF